MHPPLFADGTILAFGVQPTDVAVGAGEPVLLGHGFSLVNFQPSGEF